MSFSRGRSRLSDTVVNPTRRRVSAIFSASLLALGRAETLEYLLLPITSAMRFSVGAAGAAGFATGAGLGDGLVVRGGIGAGAGYVTAGGCGVVSGGGGGR